MNSRLLSRNNASDKVVGNIERENSLPAKTKAAIKVLRPTEPGQ